MEERRILAEQTTEYPKLSMALIVVLLVLSPFVSVYLSYVAFVICVYRMARYDAKVFATDYCILLPLTQLFRTDAGMSLLIWLCLVAAIWYFMWGKIRGDGALLFLLAIMCFLLLRMQMNIRRYVLCFGQIFVLYTLLPKQDAQSSARSAKAYCWSLAISSFYALLLRDTSQMVAVRGEESAAIWGTSIMRFYGLFEDPNYYTTLLIIGLATLCKLKDSGRMKGITFWCLGAALAVFGVMTYSKTFFLTFVLLGGIYIIWQFWNRKVFRGVFFSAAAFVAVLYVMYSENSPFAIVLERLTGGSGLADITTGRTDLFVLYWNAIRENLGSLLFGLGFNAPRLGQDPHNLYIEIIYYTGFIGLGLVLAFYISMIARMKNNVIAVKKQNIIAKYVVILMVAILYLSLHGFFELVTYGGLFIGFLSLNIIKKEEESITETEML